MDLVPCHTSIEHPWFRDRPELYVWSDEVPNNWKAAFGGPAWSWDEARGRYYLHSFYPEQPDLDWRNPEVVGLMQRAVRFWIERGIDGYRLDAIDRIGKDPDFRDDPPRTEPDVFPIHHPEYGSLEHANSKNTDEVKAALAAIREAAGDAFLVGEIYLPVDDWPRYLESLDTVFAFRLFHAPRPWEPAHLKEIVDEALEASEVPAWVFSNHDAPRLKTRLGADQLRVAAMLLLTLPGMAFLYAGDEIGMQDGPGHDPPFDRNGRDGARHPMQWDATPAGGFTTGDPWLPAVDPQEVNVADERDDPDSLLTLHRALIALRDELEGGIEFLDADEDVLAYRRGASHVVVLNLGTEERALPAQGDVALATEAGAADQGRIRPHAGAVLRVDGSDQERGL
jgi:alpha-glucosidase